MFSAWCVRMMIELPHADLVAANTLEPPGKLTNLFKPVDFPVD